MRQVNHLHDGGQVYPSGRLEGRKECEGGILELWGGNHGWQQGINFYAVRSNDKVRTL
jgi:hypothetical protein